MSPVRMICSPGSSSPVTEANPERRRSPRPSAQRYPAGTTLFQQGDPANEVFCLERGLVKLQRGNEDGHERILGLRQAPWFLGASAVILEAAYVVTAVVLTPASIRRIPAPDFRTRLSSDRELSFRLHQIHSREVYEQLVEMADLASRSARERLERFLGQLLPTLRGDESHQEVKVEVPLRGWEIAQLIAVTPPYLSKLLRELETEGLIRRRKDSLLICDPSRFR